MRSESVVNIGRINKFYFYAYTGKKCGSIMIRYTLSDTINKDRLAHAVNITLPQFPFLKLTPIVSLKGISPFWKIRSLALYIL